MTPLTVPGPGTTNAPDAGGPANVSAGRTARPTRTGWLPGGSAWLGVRSAPTVRTVAKPMVIVADDRFDSR